MKIIICCDPWFARPFASYDTTAGFFRRGRSAPISCSGRDDFSLIFCVFKLCLDFIGMKDASDGRVSGLGFTTWYGFPADIALISNHVAVKFFHYVLILVAPVDRGNTSSTARRLKILISPVSKRMLHRLLLFLFFKHSCLQDARQWGNVAV